LYIGDFASVEDIRSNFSPNEESWRNGSHGECDLTDADHIWVAVYVQESYEGGAYVLYERNGDLFEVRGGHCSCHGLEGQWAPEATTLAAIRFRVDRGGYVFSAPDSEYMDESAEAERRIQDHLWPPA
jgi:hypothetical protein